MTRRKGGVYKLRYVDHGVLVRVQVYVAVLASAVRFNDELGYVYMTRRKVVCIS